MTDQKHTINNPSISSPNKTLKPSQGFKNFTIPDESQPQQQQQIQPPQQPFQVKNPYAKELNYQEIQEFQQRMNNQQYQDQPQEYSLTEDQQAFQELEEARQEKRNKLANKPRLNEGAKKRLELLLGMTRMTKEVDIDNNKYELQTLKSKETEDVLLAASQFEGTVAYIFEIRRQYLARSLIKIAGISASQFLGEDSLEAKLVFLDELDHNFLNRLFSEYEELNKSSVDRFKINIKSKEDVDQLVDEIKKV